MNSSTLNNNNTLILLTNDDGIDSPGLWAAASTLSELGYVYVCAPREQYSGGGRSLPSNSDGLITEKEILVNGNLWKVHAVGGSPAQAALHGILEIMPRWPDLVVSGINYGENLGTGITVSGTVGAALEAAALGIPALAISLETEQRYHLSHSQSVDFSAAAHFTRVFSRMLLSCSLPEDVDVLKVDVPSRATPDTDWEITRVSRIRYYLPLAPKRDSWNVPGSIGYTLANNHHELVDGTDTHTVMVKHLVSVTPISLDLTSRVPFSDLERCLRKG
jgi:5'-nucleotidase